MGTPRRMVVGVLGVLAAVAAVALPASAAGAAPAQPFHEVRRADPQRAPGPPDTSGDETGVDQGGSTTIAPGSSDEPGTTVPAVPQRPPALVTTASRSAPLLVVPVGCPPIALPTAVFVGDLVKRDFRTAQFTVRTVRAGSLAPWAVGDQVQIRYGDDVRFLAIGATYIVGTSTDPANGLLASKLREPAALFGGDAVLGADDKDVTCPTLEDPVMTLTANATPVDSGLLTPLRHATTDLLLAVLRPFIVAFAVLLALVLVKQLLFAGGRTLRAATVTERPRPARSTVRRSRMPHTATRPRRSRSQAPDLPSPAVPSSPVVAPESGVERVIVVGDASAPDVTTR